MAMIESTTCSTHEPDEFEIADKQSSEKNFDD